MASSAPSLSIENYPDLSQAGVSTISSNFIGVKQPQPLEPLVAVESSVRSTTARWLPENSFAITGLIRSLAVLISCSSAG